MSVCENLQPKKVFEFFEQITQIPHGSYHEQEISDYLVNFAKERNLDVTRDKALNVIIRKPATKGYENAPVVILQGHMDMVCEKGADEKHDFLKDPLKLRIIGDDLYATNTTLGADDGIALAYALAILDSNDIPHPALEVVFTSSEETGMEGAIALDTKELQGKIMLNLDSEEEGIFLVGCAGGVETETTFKMEKEDISEECLSIKVNGLFGGHSGSEIDKQRGNANKLIGRILFEIRKEMDINLVEINGGTKNNAIPRECEAVISVKDINKAKEICSNMEEIFKEELRVSDPKVKVTTCDVANNGTKQFTKNLTNDVIDFLVACPNGVQNMSMDIKGLVQTSLNLAIVKTKEEEVSVTVSVRSSVKSLKNELANRLVVIAKRTNGNFREYAPYPEWQYDPESKVRDLCKKVYEELFNKEPEVTAIHAGLECGLFKETMKDTDMISFGPSIYDAHTENEHMSISSADRMYKFLLEVLKEIK